MVAWAIKLTLSPEAMTAADLEPLREAGLDDEAVHDLAAIVAYFNFVNRMALGLGVQLELPGEP
jgi:alkylhydroperoxidase family enzyme